MNLKDDRQSCKSPRWGWLLALSLLVTPLMARADHGVETDQSRLATQKRLARLNELRSKQANCPKSPMEAELVFTEQPKAGQMAHLMLNVTTEVDGAAPELRLEVPKIAGVPAPAKTVLKLDDFKAKKLYQIPLTVQLGTSGTYAIAVDIKAGDDKLKFGRKPTLYITHDAQGVRVDTENPVPPQPIQGDIGGGAHQMTPQEIASVKVNASPDRVKAFKNADHPPANTTIIGHLQYRGSDTGIHPAFGSMAEAYHWNGSSSTFLASAPVNYDGSFSIGINSGYNVFIVLRSSGGWWVQVLDSGNNGIWGSTSVLWNNITPGTHDAGYWYWDWATQGVSDSWERAYEVLDYGTTAWSYTYYSLGFGVNQTNISWFPGKTGWPNQWNHSINIPDAWYSSQDVVMHEYGHSQHQACFDTADWPPNATGDHAFYGHSNQNLAYTEGYATYFAAAAQGGEPYYDDENPSNYIHANCESNWDGGGNGFDAELVVTAFLLDIFDGQSDSDTDWLGLGGGQIQDILRNYYTSGHRPYTIKDFFYGWHSRVNAYKPQVNGLMQLHGMDMGYASYPTLGLYSGMSRYSGTWYWGGYGRGSFYVKNYGSKSYSLSQLFVWLRDPNGVQMYGGFGGDGNSNPIPSGGTREIWTSSNNVGYPDSPTGTYSLTAGHFQTGGAWRVLDPAESGTSNYITFPVVADADAPDYCNAQDDGKCVTSIGIPTSLHFTAQFNDYDSGIRAYWVCVGTTPGAYDVKAYERRVIGYQSTSVDSTVTGLSLVANQKYYITVAAENYNYQYAYGTTDGIVAYDSSAPSSVTVTDDGATTTNATSLHFVSDAVESNGCLWGYYTRVGTTPGAGDAQDWVWHEAIDQTHADAWINGLSLVNGTTYYVTVRYYNQSYLYKDGYSNGIQKVAGAVQVSGKVTLSDLGVSPAGRQVTIEIRNVGSTTPVETQVVTLDGSGNYTFYTNVTGNRDITAKSSHWLRKKIGSKNLTGTLTGVNFTLTNGDVDGDNSVTVFDYSRLSDSFDKSTGDAGFDAEADLDGDGSVTVFDYSIMSDNFDRSGDD